MEIDVDKLLQEIEVARQKFMRGLISSSAYMAIRDYNLNLILNSNKNEKI